MGRKISNDERVLWNKVAATTDKGLSEPAVFEAPKAPTKTIKNSDRPTIQHFQVGSVSKPFPSALIASNETKHRPDRRIRRGKLVPEGRIDLHGLTQAEALPELTSFIFRAAQRNLRLVLVITGKGKVKHVDGPIPERIGVLRQNVPLWLKRPPFLSLVKDVIPAHQKHGGSGAYYVFLKNSYR